MSNNFMPLRQGNVFNGLFDPDYQEEDPYSGLFGQGFEPPPQYNPYQELFPSEPLQPTPGLTDIGTLMSQLYKPEHAASDRFSQLVQNYPTREEPSTLRKIGASLMGLGAHHTPQMQETFLERPNTHRIEDWKNQITPAGTAANLERYSNANERQIAYQIASNELKERDIARKEKEGQQNIGIRQQRADIYEFKAKHPGAKIFKQPGGNVYLVDPISGEYFDTGLSSGQMTEEGAIEKKGEVAKEVAKVKGNEARRTKGTPSGSANGGKGLSPTQIKVQQYNRARELAATKPDLAEYIHLGDPGTNDFTVDKPSDGFFGHSGPTQEQYESIKTGIYGELAPASKTGNVEKSQPIVKTQTNTVTKAKRTVISYDGGKTWEVKK